MADVERELGLGRERLVELALLLGSDYTEVGAGGGGVGGVGVGGFERGAGSACVGSGRGGGGGVCV